MAISKSRRWLAWAEIQDSPTITIVDLKSKDDKKVKILQSLDTIKSKQFVSIDFVKGATEKDEIKYMAALTGGPEYQLVHFNVNKNSILSVTPIKAAFEG